MKKLIFLLLLSSGCHALSWQCTEGMVNWLCRTEVPHGWIIKHPNGITFYPDEKHEWKL